MLLPQRGRSVMNIKDLIGKHLSKSIAIGCVLTIVGFFTGQTVFTFPPLWLDLLRIFLIYTLTFLVINVLVDWVHDKLKRRKRD